ncbi:TatD family hydrolase [Evansella sp. AB-P1]|uniref:TatD family hydrolase n=1 Tax=Evansella sp. AB-P1 TaxID=3037653 RepID=UPI00241DB193|nr:TatD family hydrolase [Evansella sp. AB-P1]MDG5788571.1 TatD family hydrolase [Evansella sp. AB-P1]
MYHAVIDSHIHLEVYKKGERLLIIEEMEKYNVEQLISVSMNLASARKNLSLSREYKNVKTAIGFHPEQILPSEKEIEQLHDFLDQHQQEMVAVGEVGLPYYLRQNNQQIPIEPYLEILESFIIKAKQYNKPIILHAVYDDAPIVCSMLEKHSIEKAHFHWFKGDAKTVERMIKNGYYISITPDVMYKDKIQQLVKKYPITNMIVETDGPWPFEGPFENKMTHPKMIHKSIEKISSLKGINLPAAYRQFYKNTKEFYKI